jgi:preprotein translocase subunit SecB
MKPILSPLLLERYFVTDLLVQANKSFKPDSIMNLGFEALQIDSEVLPPTEGTELWEVTLRLFHQGNEKINTPYFFRVELVGSFSVGKSYPRQNVEWLVRTNAPSVLYSTAREVLRSAMASGPFKAIILPAVSFYTDEMKSLIARKAAK